ncbi:uncharacterized protein LOC131628150 [Vicia villosa]|uniref:uncharacterized protein LOC131628150 n=1 Tax=Vicia villosa TaxID=3911 RepID=UPI00273B6009|nr:uncharacterized protein LOC131628150 [Vicia villosa]
MWPNVESEDLLPPDFKKGPGRPRKLRIRETGEEGARRRLPGVSYRCTRCDKIGHNIKSCKSKVQDPSALKRKKKGQLRAANNASVDTCEANPTATNEVKTNVVKEANPNEVRTCEASASEGNPSQGKPRAVKTSQAKTTPAEESAKNKGKAQVNPVRKRVSERIKENWFKKPKPFTGPGSAPEQPFLITEEGDGNDSQRKKKTTPKKTMKKTPKKKSINDL